jgi:hypothetical protein
MSDVINYVNIQITKLLKPVSKAGMTTICVVAEDATFSGRIQYYSTSDLAAIAADLTAGVASTAYLACQAIAAQNPRPALVAIGREDAGDANITATLDAIFAESRDFFGLILAERDKTKQTDTAIWAAVNYRIFATASSEAAIADTTDVADTTSLAALYKAASNAYVSLFFDSNAATQYIDAAYLGHILPKKAGSYTGAFKTLGGVTIDNLTTTQSKNCHDKFCNTYEELGEVNVVLDGFVSSGEYTDITVFIEWVRNRMTENIWSLQVNSDKIPYTDPGLNTIDNGMKQTLDIGQKNGGISPHTFNPTTKVRTGGYETFVPLAADVPQVDKLNREFNDGTFTAWLAGAIHKTVINGVVTQ